MRCELLEATGGESDETPRDAGSDSSDSLAATVSNQCESLKNDTNEAVGPFSDTECNHDNPQDVTCGKFRDSLVISQRKSDESLDAGVNDLPDITNDEYDHSPNVTDNESVDESLDVATVSHDKSCESPSMTLSDCSSEVLAVDSQFTGGLSSAGFECGRLLVGWYNKLVSRPFILPYHPHTLGYVVVSTPAMFERTFLPWLRAHRSSRASSGGRDEYSLTGGSRHRDPLDTCMRQVIGGAANNATTDATTALVMHDFEQAPGGARRPLVLVQTACHVAAVARFYRPQDVYDAPHTDCGEIPAHGVCIHPRYGGWFAIRAVVVFDGILAPDLKQMQPPQAVRSRADQRSLLRLYNWHWRDSRYRDVLWWRRRERVPRSLRYSAAQQLYFNTPPCHRHALITDTLLPATEEPSLHEELSISQITGVQ